MISYTYLLVNFFTIIICFIFSFDKRIAFYKFFGSYLKAAIIVGIPFIIWDIIFTIEGIWWFNDSYLIGYRIFGLPIEECLFFICIPFSCTFTYFCVNKFYNLAWANSLNNIITFITCIFCIVIAMLHYDKTYTLVTTLITLFSILYFHFIYKNKFIGIASVIYTLLMLGFFPVNGILTGTWIESPIVNYNESAFLGIRIGTIPIEDAVYGYTQFLWIIFFFNHFAKNLPYKCNIKEALE